MGDRVKDKRLMRAVSIIFWVFLVISFSQVHGEDIIRWTDEAGRPYYSNVSPSADVKVYSVDTISRPAASRPIPAQAYDPADAGEKIPAEAEEENFDYSAGLLKQRITERKRSIGHIEALLRKRPNDSGLRKSLSRKKRYLFEDLTRLKNVQR